MTSASHPRRRRRSAAQWRELVARHPHSGLSVAAFCQQHDVHPMSFYHWRRRLRITGAAAAESVGVTSGVYRAQDAHDAKTLEASKAREAPRFLRLQVTDAVTASPPDALAVRFACGTELHCSPTHLATLVALLRQPSDAAAPTPAPHRPARQGVS